LIEHGASVHAALATTDRPSRDRVLQVLLAAGADPNVATFPGRETGCFMRDSRTSGETALHRAAAYGSETSIDLLLAAGARLDARDAHGDSPLSWASRHLRPGTILRTLCFSPFRIHPERRLLAESLLGEVLPP